MKTILKAVSLFTGAGGMDVGFSKAQIKTVWANELDDDAATTFDLNYPGILERGDIRRLLPKLADFRGVDLVFGGPPCQGFSVAGKMDPHDERNMLVRHFMEAVAIVRPRGFVCENVKALGTLEKWSGPREYILTRAAQLGYGCSFIVLNSADYGVPQKRERVFFIGALGKVVTPEELQIRFQVLKKKPPKLRDVIGHLGPAGSATNPRTCTARITLAANPILRRSRYAGMLFNGAGRPMDLDGYSATLPASMGGNKTPIVDEAFLHGEAKDEWVKVYHEHLMKGGKPLPFEGAPERLRRLTITEARIIQTFPAEFMFHGSKSSIYKQIGNAVPCLLAKAVANVIADIIENRQIKSLKRDEQEQTQQFLEF